jgi:hypothetical protein
MTAAAPLRRSTAAWRFPTALLQTGMACTVRWTLAVIVALAATWLGDDALAQTAPSSPQSKFAPVEVPNYDVESLKTPKTTIPDSAGQSKLKTPDPAASATKLPTQVDLGKYKLDFKAGRTSDVAPRTGLDSGETSNLSKINPGGKSESATPDYFGLKLSAPTQ